MGIRNRRGARRRQATDSGPDPRKVGPVQARVTLFWLLSSACIVAIYSAVSSYCATMQCELCEKRYLVLGEVEPCPQGRPFWGIMRLESNCKQGSTVVAKEIMSAWQMPLPHIIQESEKSGEFLPLLEHLSCCKQSNLSVPERGRDDYTA